MVVFNSLACKMHVVRAHSRSTNCHNPLILSNIENDLYFSLSIPSIRVYRHHNHKGCMNLDHIVQSIRKQRTVVDCSKSPSRR